MSLVLGPYRNIEKCIETLLILFYFLKYTFLKKKYEIKKNSVTRK
jgi:hypothetical protein